MRMLHVPEPMLKRLMRRSRTLHQITHERRYRLVDAYDRDGSHFYVFERPVPGDSRVDQVTCTSEWFWKGRSS